MSEIFCYTVRIVQYHCDLTAFERRNRLASDELDMVARGWKAVYTTHHENHSATLYRRASPLNYVDTYASGVADSSNPL